QPPSGGGSGGSGGGGGGGSGGSGSPGGGGGGGGGPPGAGSAWPIPVPGPVVLSGPLWGEYNIQFHVPFPWYAFATAHVWFALDRAAVGPMAAMRESPSAFFATALKESYLGCSDKLPPLDLYHPGMLYTRTASYGDGCFQIESTTAWAEMCRM